MHALLLFGVPRGCSTKRHLDEGHAVNLNSLWFMSHIKCGTELSHLNPSTLGLSHPAESASSGRTF